MDRVTFKFWVGRASELEKDLIKWKNIAKRLAVSVHDPNCEYAVQCSYCDALKEVEKLR